MDNMKKLFQGKKGKIFLAVAAFVAVVGFVVYKRRQAAAAGAAVYANVPQRSDSTGGTSTGAAAGGVSLDEVKGLLDQYQQGSDTKMKQLADAQLANNQNLVGAFNAALGQQKAGFDSNLSGVQSGFQHSIADLTAQLHDSLAAQAQQKLDTNHQQPTYDHISDTHTVTNLLGKSWTVTTPENVTSWNDFYSRPETKDAFAKAYAAAGPVLPYAG